ncbi:MAG: RNA polymerase sigma factor, partial [Solirubrobacteraceae bacterium]
MRISTPAPTSVTTAKIAGDVATTAATPTAASSAQATRQRVTAAAAGGVAHDHGGGRPGGD